MAKQIYVCDSAPNLSIRVKDGDGKDVKDLVVQFKDKQLILDDDEDAEAIALLDKGIAERVNISQLVKKMDLIRAERIAREHRRNVDQQNMQMKGGANAGVGSAMRVLVQVDELRIRMQSDGMTDEQIDKAVKELEEQSNLVLPVRGEPGVSTPNDGFIPDPTADHDRQLKSALDTKTDGPAAPPPPPAINPAQRTQFSFGKK